MIKKLTRLCAPLRKKLRVILIDRLGELVGAGGALHAAGVASQDVSYLFGILAFDELTDGLEVAVAAAGEDDVVKDAVLDVKRDRGRTGSAGTVGILQDEKSCLI